MNNSVDGFESQYPMHSDEISCASADFRPAEEVYNRIIISLNEIFNFKWVRLCR